MKKLIFYLFFASFLQAQTKLISHKSHSGTAANFRIAVTNNLFDIESSNLGVAPERIVRNAVLDTVIFISKDKQIMITSDFCNRENIYSKKTEVTKWSAGKDTVFQHELFSNQHALDSIKQVLKNQFYFKNNIDKVVFIGFDNKKRKNKKKNDFPMLDFNKNIPFKGLLIVVFFATLFSFFYWKIMIADKSSIHDKII